MTLALPDTGMAVAIDIGEADLLALGKKIEAKGLKQITHGAYNNLDPCWLPDGRIAFTSQLPGHQIMPRLFGGAFAVDDGDDAVAIPAPPLRLDNLQGEPRSLADYAGRVVLVNFWASWCGPCITEIPSLRDLHARMAHEPFEIVAVNVKEGRFKVHKFSRMMSMPFPVLLDPDGEAFAAWDAHVLPTSFLVDGAGRRPHEDDARVGAAPREAGVLGQAVEIRRVDRRPVTAELAEAGVEYDKIYDLDDINPQFPQADVAQVIGANDVVNPVARSNPDSPIYGMPILDADKAQNTIVIKRGQGAGFSGIENHLFYADNTRMLYGDGQKAVGELIAGVKQL